MVRMNFHIGLAYPATAKADASDAGIYQKPDILEKRIQPAFCFGKADLSGLIK